MLMRQAGLSAFPVASGYAYKDTFGMPWGAGRTHQGIDIFAPRGTPVRAVADGTVSFREDPMGGNTLTLTTEDGMRYYYAHLDDDTRVTMGAVKAGTTIGGVGDTGNATQAGPHLHFELRGPTGLVLNPYPLLRAAESRAV